MDGLSGSSISEFKKIIESGENDRNKLTKIKRFTANDFFKACAIGYDAIGKDINGMSLVDIYTRFSDGRDEGLTGRGHGLNEGPGINFDSPEEWDEWFYHRPQRGGHPWEVVPGGSFSLMELYVRNDADDLEYEYQSSKINKESHEKSLKHTGGYYFCIVGRGRLFESVNFYLALHKAGFPVIIYGAQEILSKLEAKDTVGVVPHDMPLWNCNSLFPEGDGDIFDYTYVHKEDDKWFHKIKWLPISPSEIDANWEP
jgi:hypothetical protein